MKHHEFWHPRLFEIPYYLTLAGGCLVKGMGISTLARANYALDHGEIGIGSKFDSQMQFDQSHFPMTFFLQGNLNDADKQDQLESFAKQTGYPFILKPDAGHVGKGVLKVCKREEISQRLPQMFGNYLVQSFCPHTFECGIFYVRRNDRPRITGINAKHFPSIVGNGQDTIETLARQHPRHSHHWASFLQYLDLDRVPDKDETVCLSFIGSHTLGCKFTDDSDLLTDRLKQSVFDLFASQPGFNFGRIDVKSESVGALQSGEFTVIEVNGVASLPTHMFDPRYSAAQAYRIFLRHAWLLVQCADEHRYQPMQLLSLPQLVGRVREGKKILERSHLALMGKE